jgi:hypothetical protein
MWNKNMVKYGKCGINMVIMEMNMVTVEMNLKYGNTHDSIIWEH